VRDIEYQLLPGSDRQTTDIVIERDGIITVRPPKRMTPEQVDETVLAKRMWIYRNLAEWRDLNATASRANGSAAKPSFIWAVATG
jgi:predicted metal-dependent hydrolase